MTPQLPPMGPPMNDAELTRLADIYTAALAKWADIEIWKNESFDAQTEVDNAMSELCQYVADNYGSNAPEPRRRTRRASTVGVSTMSTFILSDGISHVRRGRRSPVAIPGKPPAKRGVPNPKRSERVPRRSRTGVCIS